MGAPCLTHRNLARANLRAPARIRRSGGSRGLGRTYFFLAELLLLDPLLLELLFEPELELFLEPLDDLVGILLSFRRDRTAQA